MSDMGRILIGIGLLLVVVGAVVLLLGRFNVPIGRLPGDISWQNRSGNTRIYFPLATSIILSLLLSLILWAVSSFRR